MQRNGKLGLPWESTWLQWSDNEPAVSLRSACSKYFFITKNKKMLGKNDRNIWNKILSSVQSYWLLTDWIISFQVFFCSYIYIFLKICDYIVFLFWLHLFQIKKKLAHNTKLLTICSNWSFHMLLGENKISADLCKTVWWSLLKLNIQRAE